MPRSTILGCFNVYLEKLATKLGGAGREASFKDHCHGLILPLRRKRSEPVDNSVDLEYEQACIRALDHFVPKATRSVRTLLSGMAPWILHWHRSSTPPYWIIDHTSICRRGGPHSVGVCRLSCGEIVFQKIRETVVASIRRGIELAVAASRLAAVGVLGVPVSQGKQAADTPLTPLITIQDLEPRMRTAKLN